MVQTNFSFQFPFGSFALFWDQSSPPLLKDREKRPGDEVVN